MHSSTPTPFPFRQAVLFIIFWYVYLPSITWVLSDTPDPEWVVKRATIHADRGDPSPEVMSFHPDITDCEQSIFRSKIRVEDSGGSWACELDMSRTVSRSLTHLFCAITLTRSFVLRPSLWIFEQERDCSRSILYQNNKMAVVCKWNKPILWALNFFLL